MPEFMPATSKLVRQLDERYQDCGHATRGYVRWKLRLDPVHAAIFKAARARPLGHVLDLGCGRGQMGIALLLQALAEHVTGIDWDAPLIEQASRAARGLPASFIAADLRQAELPSSQCTLLLDLLYQVTFDQQESLLRRAARATADRLYLRVLDPDQGWRSKVGQAAERFSRLVGLYRKAAIDPTPPARFATWLEDEGFACSIEPCWGRTPFPNMLLTATRRPAR